MRGLPVGVGLSSSSVPQSVPQVSLLCPCNVPSMSLEYLFSTLLPVYTSNVSLLGTTLIPLCIYPLCYSAVLLRFIYYAQYYAQEQELLSNYIRVTIKFGETNFVQVPKIHKVCSPQ